MHEVKKPKKNLAYYYLIVMLVLMLFNAFAMPYIAEQQVEEAIAHYDNVVIMKAGGSIGRILELMKKYDRAESCATVISCVGMKDEYIGSLDPERIYSYFTTVIIKREKR